MAVVHVRHRDHRIRRNVRIMLTVTALSVGGCKSGRQAPVAGVPERLPVEAARFSIVATTDSTVHFKAGDVRWLQIGMNGYAVDPTERDAFVARLALIGETGGEYTALVTGQVRPVDSTHVVIVERPAVPTWRKRDFWWGAAWGGVAGAVLAIVAKIAS